LINIQFEIFSKLNYNDILKNQNLFFISYCQKKFWIEITKKESFRTILADKE